MDEVQSAPHPPRGRSICIIGAGPTAIGQTYIFQQMGYTVTTFEREEVIGGVWVRAYAEASVQNNIHQYHLSGFPYPFETDYHPTSSQIVRYLEACVEKYKMDVRTSKEVLKVEQFGEDHRWRVYIRNVRNQDISTPGELEDRKADEVLEFDKLIVATGQFWQSKQREVVFQGEENFRGTIVREQEVKDGPALFKGKDVVVCGFGKSAIDILSLAERSEAKSISHVFREPRFLIPKYIFGIHFTHLMMCRASTVLIPSWDYPTEAERTLHADLSPIVSGFWSFIRGVVYGQSRLGIAGEEVDQEGMERFHKVQMRSDQTVVYHMRSAIALDSDLGYYKSVATKKVEPHIARISELRDNGVVLSSPEEEEKIIPADVLVVCFGSGSPKFPFFSKEIRETLLETEKEGLQCYRHILVPEIPNLAFGGNNHGFLHWPAAEIAAIWLGALWDGDLILPSVEEMRETIKKIQEFKRENSLFEPSGFNGINTRFHQYLDSMLIELGISPYRKLPNIFAEVGMQYSSADYAGCLKEYYEMKAKRNAPLTSKPFLQ